MGASVSKENQKFAIFLGTGNTYCRFLIHLGIEAKDNLKDCYDRHGERKCAIIGQDIDHYDHWTKQPMNDYAKALLVEPISGKPFPKGTIIYLPGRRGVVKEIWRVSKETLFGPSDPPEARFKPLGGQSFDRVYCHSNGCTQAQKAAEIGKIYINQILHLGAPHMLTDDIPNNGARFIL